MIKKIIKRKIKARFRKSKKDFKKNSINYYKDYKKIPFKKIDVVFVTLPNYLAPKVTIYFLEKNIHVFCEKPPGRNVQDVKDVLKVFKKNNKLKLKIDPHELILGKKITGSWGGSVNPDIDFKKFSMILKKMKFNSNIISSKVYNLENINNAIKEFKVKKNFRPIIKMSH